MIVAIDMGDRSKSEARRQAIIESMESYRPAPEWKPPPCACGAVATHEINRVRKDVDFVCARHVPDDF